MSIFTKAGLGALGTVMAIILPGSHAFAQTNNCPQNSTIFGPIPTLGCLADALNAWADVPRTDFPFLTTYIEYGLADAYIDNETIVDAMFPTTPTPASVNDPSVTQWYYPEPTQMPNYPINETPTQPYQTNTQQPTSYFINVSLQNYPASTSSYFISVPQP